MPLAFSQWHLYRLDFMVRPTGFEPAAFRVGVIRQSNKKACIGNGFSGIAQF